jgi:exodeoxyribonuclease VII small subunit
MNASTAQPDPVPGSWEEAHASLERIVRAIESGELSLEESILKYREGVALVNWLRKALVDAQQQISILETDLLKPFTLDAAPQ